MRDGALRAGRFPDSVPVLVDPALGLTLRAHSRLDLPAVVELANDPETVRFTTVPVPYGTEQGGQFLEAVAAGWRWGTGWSWALEAERDERPQFCGTVSIGLDSPVGEVGFSLHPGARGRGLTVGALRLVRDHAFEVGGLAALRWRARTGNWASRRVAAAVGFRFDGTVRRLLDHRGTWVDGWIATLLADDPREDLRWRRPVGLTGEQVRLRPLQPDDADRIVEACNDPRSQHWLGSLPRPYTVQHAIAYVEATHEAAAAGTSWTWCVADAADRCQGAVSLDGFGAYHRRGEIGYWLHPEGRGHGLMTEAVGLVTGFADQTEMDSLQIRCAEGNHASRHVAEACGFREAGRLTAAEPLGDDTLSDLVVYTRP